MRTIKCAGLALTLLFLVQSSTAKCKPSISYSGDTWHFGPIALPWHISGVDVQRKKELVQAASVFAQIFDGAQVASCNALEKLQKSGMDNNEYRQRVNEHSDALFELAKLQSILAANPQDTDKGTAELAKWIPGAIQHAESSKQPEVQEMIKDPAFDAAKKKVQAAVTDEVSPKDNQDKNPKPWWALIPKQNVPLILDQLREAVRTLSLSLRASENEIRASLRVHGGDGFLYRPAGFAVQGENQIEGESLARILLYYGAAGVAYTDNVDQLVIVPRKGQNFTFTIGDSDKERKARAVLVNPELERHVEENWVIALPITVRRPAVGGTEEVIAVLDLSSSRVNVSEDELNKAYGDSRGALKALLTRLGRLLSSPAGPAH